MTNDMSPENSYREKGVTFSPDKGAGDSGRSGERKEEAEFNPSWLIRNEREFNLGLGGKHENEPKGKDDPFGTKAILRNFHHQAQLPPDERNGERGWEVVARELERRADLMVPGSQERDFVNVAVRRIEEYVKFTKNQPNTHNESGYKYREPDNRDTFYRKRKGTNANSKRQSNPSSQQEPIHESRRDQASGIMYVDTEGNANYQPPPSPEEPPLPFDDTDGPNENVIPPDDDWYTAAGGRAGGNGGENEPPQPPNNGGNNEAPIPFDEEPAKIEKPIKSLGPREVLAGLDLARTPEEQLHLVRELLSRLESNNSLLKENENSPTVAALEERLNDMLPEVRREVNARIHLKESAAVVRVLTSSDETTQQRYRDLYTEAERNENRRLLRNEDFTELLSKTETNGIPVQMAFNTLQQVAYEGIRLKDGTVKKYMDDKTTVQEEEFNELLSQRMISIVRYNNETDEDVRERVRVALALADKVALATLEKHVWMVDNFMASPIAQAFYLHDYRKIGDPGPIVTQRLIWGFGTSFFRQARYEEGGSKKYLFNSAEWQDVKQERRQRYAAYKTHTLQRIMPKRASDHVKETIRRGIQTIKNPRDRSERQRYFDNFRFEQNPNELLLNIGEVDYTKLSSTEYNRYLISYVPKILKVRELLLTETFDIKDLTSSDKVNSWYSAFDKMDPDNKLQLRGDFLYGAIYQMLSGGVLQHATGAELSQVYRVFTAPRRYIDDVEGNEKVDQFITPDELWKMLEDQRAWHRAGVNSVMTALAGIYQTTRR